MPIPQHGLLQIFGGIKPGCCQHFADAAIESLHHAIGLGMARWNQSMFDTMPYAGLVKYMFSRRLSLAGGAKAIGEGLVIVGEQFADNKRSLVH